MTLLYRAAAFTRKKISEMDDGVVSRGEALWDEISEEAENESLCLGLCRGKEQSVEPRFVSSEIPGVLIYSLTYIPGVLICSLICIYICMYVYMWIYIYIYIYMDMGTSEIDIFGLVLEGHQRETTGLRGSPFVKTHPVCSNMAYV